MAGHGHGIHRTRPESAERPQPADFVAAGLALAPFTVYLVAVALVAPPSLENWAEADPILRLLPGHSAPVVVPLVGAIPGAFLWLRGRPGPDVLRRASGVAVAGAAFAALAVCGLRLAVGPVLPAFIPADESAGPGLCLSMCAGYGEELVCRLGVLWGAWHVLSPRLPRVPAVALSALACALAFAVLHALGEPEPSTTYFITRLVIPGTLFSLAALVVHPSFVVVAHCTAHLFIPVLFVAS